MYGIYGIQLNECVQWIQKVIEMYGRAIASVRYRLDRRDGSSATPANTDKPALMYNNHTILEFDDIYTDLDEYVCMCINMRKYKYIHACVLICAESERRWLSR